MCKLWELQRKRFETNRGNRKLCHLNPFEFFDHTPYRAALKRARGESGFHARVHIQAQSHNSSIVAASAARPIRPPLTREAQASTAPVKEIASARIEGFATTNPACL